MKIYILFLDFNIRFQALNLISKFTFDFAYSTFDFKIYIRFLVNLSPILFALYLNDLEHFLEDKRLRGLESISEETDSKLQIYLKLFVILYADDTAILAESTDDLQKQLDSFNEYCNVWKLKVNVTKTKVMNFSRDRMLSNLHFNIDGTDVEIVKEFNYLDILLSRNGNSKIALKHLSDKATKAMFNVLK